MPVAFFIYPSGGSIDACHVRCSRNRPARIGEAEKSRSIFSKQRFLGNFSLPFPDKDLGHGSAATFDF
jgi:hypothetical protein